MSADILMFSLLIVAGLIGLSSFDDLVIDLVYWCRRLRTGVLNTLDRSGSPQPSQGPKIGVFIANWQEADVLGHVIAGNLAAVDYARFRIYLGVYPNDTATLRVAQQLARGTRIA